jgi:hypothetical protein
VAYVVLYGAFASVNDRVAELGELRAFTRGVILGCYLERNGLGIEPDRDAQPRTSTVKQ